MPVYVNSLILLSSLLLAGCIDGVRRDQPIEGLGAADLPRYQIGDRRYLSNGKYEEVIELDGDVVTWRDSSGTRYRAKRNFIFPELLRESRGRRVVNEFEVNGALLWPLEPGNKGWFAARRITLNKGSGRRIESKRDWYCRVNDGQRLRAAAGHFDTYRVECERTNEMGKFRQRWHWYYSPLLEQVVLRRVESPSRLERQLELVAFQPSLGMLSDVESKAYRERFQWVMEHLASGNTDWYEVQGSAYRIAVIPLQTLRLGDGHYCRTYRTRVISGAQGRWGAGIVCRDDSGHWRIPGHSV